MHKVGGLVDLSSRPPRPMRFKKSRPSDVIIQKRSDTLAIGRIRRLMGRAIAY